MKKSETTKQWWGRVSSSPEEINNWLKNQYHGEVTAAKRIASLSSKYNLNKLQKRIINSIIKDEIKHAKWIKDILIDRGIEAKVLKKEERYWDKVLPTEMTNDSFKYFCAVGHLAETMRLDRIEIIAEDKNYHSIGKVFKKIYNDEIFHAKAFGLMSSKKMISKAQIHHNNGINAIGLLP